MKKKKAKKEQPSSPPEQTLRWVPSTRFMVLLLVIVLAAALGGGFAYPYYWIRSRSAFKSTHTQAELTQAQVEAIHQAAIHPKETPWLLKIYGESAVAAWNIRHMSTEEALEAHRLFPEAELIRK